MKDRRYKRTEFPSRWNDEESGAIIIPKNTPYLPLIWYEPGVTRIYEWERVIDRHPPIANGWTKQSLEAMQRLLNGDIVMLNGKLRLIPSSANITAYGLTEVAARQLLSEAETHIAAGRIPILKDETKAKILHTAIQRDRASGVSRQRSDPQQGLAF